jgi:hypothetical protein
MTIPKPLRKLTGMLLLLSTAGLIPWVALFRTLFG